MSFFTDVMVIYLSKVMLFLIIFLILGILLKNRNFFYFGLCLMYSCIPISAIIALLTWELNSFIDIVFWICLSILTRGAYRANIFNLK